jgi:ATP-dependent exoDNAse (exonuclease V) alpha subunit
MAYRTVADDVDERGLASPQGTFEGRAKLLRPLNVLTVTIFDKGEIVRNGAALHIDQGIAVTSHASQAKTVDQVIVSVPVRAFSQANEAQFYVSMSRARSAMYVFTDSKVALREAVTKPSKRLSSWEIVNGGDKERALKVELNRQLAKARKEQQEITYER